MKASEITTEHILSLYEKVLPLLYDNPEKLDVANGLNMILMELVPYDFFTYCMEDPKAPSDDDLFSFQFSRWSDNNADALVQDTSTINFDTSVVSFETTLAEMYKRVLDQTKKRFPHKTHEYHHYRIQSYEYPKIVIDLFRFKDEPLDRSFTTDEMTILELLTPHLIVLFRTLSNFEIQSRAFKYFSVFNKICTNLAHSYNLSDTEYRIMTELLFGHSNEQIAERSFVSVATVKTHIKHIFKKTGTKSRVDFLSKFFTSPERVDL